jgi:hypothetical protein
MIARGTLKSFDSGSWTATVRLAGSLATYVTVPVSRGIASAELVAGRNVAVLLLDASNPNDAVLAAVW